MFNFRFLALQSVDLRNPFARSQSLVHVSPRVTFSFRIWAKLVDSREPIFTDGRFSRFFSSLLIGILKHRWLCLARNCFGSQCGAVWKPQSSLFSFVCVWVCSDKHSTSHDSFRGNFEGTNSIKVQSANPVPLKARLDTAPCQFISVLCCICKSTKSHSRAQPFLRFAHSVELIAQQLQRLGTLSLRKEHWDQDVGCTSALSKPHPKNIKINKIKCSLASPTNGSSSARSNEISMNQLSSVESLIQLDKWNNPEKSSRSTSIEGDLIKTCWRILMLFDDEKACSIERSI